MAKCVAGSRVNGLGSAGSDGARSDGAGSTYDPRVPRRSLPGILTGRVMELGKGGIET